MLVLLMDMAGSPEDKIKVEALYRKYDRLMYYIAGKILSRQEDIEDAVMEAWVRIIRNLDKISEVSSPKTKSYLVIVVERTSIDVYNKMAKQRYELPIENYEQSPFFAVTDQSVEDVEVYRFLRSLPKKYGEVLVLYYMQDMEVSEIARQLKISEDTVYKRIQRGKTEVKKRWVR